MKLALFISSLLFVGSLAHAGWEEISYSQPSQERKVHKFPIAAKVVVWNALTRTCRYQGLPQLAWSARAKITGPVSEKKTYAVKLESHDSGGAGDLAFRVSMKVQYNKATDKAALKEVCCVYKRCQRL